MNKLLLGLSKPFKYILTLTLGFFLFFKSELIIFAAQVMYDTARNSETEIIYKNNEMTLTSDVIATLHDHIYVGYATGYADGNGILEITSLNDINVKCIGEFSYTSIELLSGKGTASCSDGNNAVFNFKGIDNSKGYGYGTSKGTPVLFTYGMRPNDAQNYLIPRK